MLLVSRGRQVDGAMSMMRPVIENAIRAIDEIVVGVRKESNHQMLGSPMLAAGSAR